MQTTVANKEVFFTKKRVILFTIALIVFVLIVFLTSKFLFDINFKTISNLLTNSAETNKLFFIWLFLLFIFPFYNCFLRIYTYLYKLRKKNIFVEWYNWIFFCLVTFFIGGITPFAMGAEPYIIYWLKRRGLTLKESTSLVASFTVINPFVQVLITWPSFFILCSQYSNFANDYKWIGCFWSVFVGLLIDLIGTCFWTLMSYSKNAHYILNLIINYFKKIFRMKWKTKEEIRYEYKENATFKKMFINELKDIKFVIFITIGSLLWNVLYYCEIIFAFNLMDPTLSFNPGELFNYVNVATTANNFIPIPGAEGSLQAVLIVFIQNSSTNINMSHAQIADITNNSVFIWRTFSFYITTIAGLGSLILLICKESYKQLVKKLKLKYKYDENSFLIIVKATNNDVLNTLKSIEWINYDNNLLEVIVVKQNNNKLNLEQYKNLNLSLINVDSMNNLDILKKINQKNMINKKYLNILNSGDLLTFDSLASVNNVFREYDVYANQYKKYINNKLLNKIKPFKYIYFKRFDKKEKMLTSSFNFSSFIFSAKLIKKFLNNSHSKTSNDFSLYLELIKYASNLRYRKKVFALKKDEYLNIEDNNYNLQLLNDVVKQNNELAVDLVMTNNMYKNVLFESESKLKLENKINFISYPWYIRFFKKLQFNMFFRNKYFY